METIMPADKWKMRSKLKISRRQMIERGDADARVPAVMNKLPGEARASPAGRRRGVCHPIKFPGNQTDAGNVFYGLLTLPDDRLEKD